MGNRPIPENTAHTLNAASKSRDELLRAAGVVGQTKVWIANGTANGHMNAIAFTPDPTRTQSKPTDTVDGPDGNREMDAMAANKNHRIARRVT